MNENGALSTVSGPEVDSGTSEILEERVGASFRGSAWVSERLLLTIFHTRRFRDWDTELTVQMDGAMSPPLTHAHRFPLDDDGMEGRVLLTVLPDGGRGTVSGLHVQARSWRRALVIDSALIEERRVDLRTLLRRELADLESRVRADLVELLSSSADWQSEAGGGLALARSLNQIRDGLREPLPTAVRDRAEPRGLAVDAILAIDERSFWIKGWYRDADSRPSCLMAVSPEGMSVDLLPGAYRHDRADVRSLYGITRPHADERYGFVHYVQLPGPSRSTEGWMCELHSELGSGVECVAPSVAREPTEVRNRVLSEILNASDDRAFLARNHVQPAIKAWMAAQGEAAVEKVLTFGTPPAQPPVSVIMPVHGRLGLLEHAFAEFVHDADFARAELILVLDSPEHADRLLALAADLHGLYGTPFRVALLDRNAGLARAANLGAELARGKLLTFMHCDVLPRTPGWLRALASEHARIPKVGALCPRLLFEDGTIQSAGLQFRAIAEGADVTEPRWEASGLLRGLHPRLPAAARSREVHAASDACLMVAADLFRTVGGFCTEYVQAGFSDTDLSLRLHAAGHPTWYAASAELYHLGGQSLGGRVRDLTDAYNGWLHDARWATRIEQLSEQIPGRGMTLRSGEGV